ncbi:MAG: apolipoprotein N-acyltransferase [Deltaproteobacteria bacterium]|nr:apolipoprotein N-acyltransferase [Deltaproteobacteria bacterium]
MNDNGTKLKALTTRGILLAILSGLMLTASFPPGKFSFLAWVALVPLLVSVDRASPSLAFRLGFVAGAAHFTTLMYWIVMVLGHYGNMNAIVSLGPFFLLCFFLALYPALFSMLTTCLKDSRFEVILMASFWVSLEYIRGVFLTGLPWCLLGYSQYEHLHLIQVADITGVYGVSFLIVLFNGLIFHLLFKGKEKGRGVLKRESLIIALAAAVAVAYGSFRLSQGLPGGDAPTLLRTAVIQPNIDQSVKWDPTYQSKTMSIYEGLTRSSYGFRPELIVWPEAALPFFFQNNAKFAPRVFSLAEESGALLIFGSPAYKRAGRTTRYYNRAYLIGRENKPPQHYDKVHLVPFGEYVPFKSLLSFVNRLVPAAGDFASGHAKGPMRHGELSPGVIICFEAIFPDLARAHARGGAKILVNMTNDAWFGMSSAPHQHLSMAAFRAVENKRPLVRAANTGISAFIDAHGKIVLRGSLFTRETLKASVNVTQSPFTFYTRFGDIFAFLLLAFSSIKLLSFFWHRKNAKP